MTDPKSPQTSSAALDKVLLAEVDAVIRNAAEANLPLEIDPTRGKLFELFVAAHGAGFLEEGNSPDLTAESLCKQLASRWGLDTSAQQSVAQQAKLPPEDLSKMRTLWSLLRMWMEWTYAWDRWEEFHPDPDESDC